MKKKLLFLLVLVVSLFTLGSCAFFEEDAEGVKDITFSENEEGDVVVTITYYDEFESTKEQIIPSGLDGKDGISVSIEVVREKDLYRNKVILNLSDGTQQVMYVPDGVRIVDVTTTDFEGANGMILHYSDGSQSDAIRLPKGDKGEGIDVKKSTWTVNEDGSVDVVIYYTETDEPITFTIPTGKKGNGIESITPIEKDGKYGLEIKYTNEDPVEIFYTRPVFWYQGYGEPTRAENYSIVQNAVVGDYFFDYFQKKIYVLQSIGVTGQLWDMVVDFSQAENICIVSFDPNLGEDIEHPSSSFQTTFSVRYGETLYGQLAQPTRSGYTFMGWASSRNVTPTTGFLTDLTPITSNITVYAIWQKNE